MAHSTAQLKIRTARLSVASNSLLIVLKLAVGILTHSLSIMAEAVHSGVDLVAALMAYVSVRKSAEPPDHEHHYGHGKFESLAAAAEGVLILAVALGIAYKAVWRIIGANYEVRFPLAGAAVMVVGGAVNLWVSRQLFRVARESDSIALEADAWHLSTDVYTMAGVLAAMLLITLGQALRIHGIAVADPIAALIVAAVITRAAWDITHRAAGQLADVSLPPEQEARIEALIGSHYPQFVAFHQLRSRAAGSERHIDLHLEVPPAMSVAEAHALCDHLEQDIRALMPNSEVLIHVEPARRRPREERRAKREE
jgi:cation diffusion facilitator family transporter